MLKYIVRKSMCRTATSQDAFLWESVAKLQGWKQITSFDVVDVSTGKVMKVERVSR